MLRREASTVSISSDGSSCISSVSGDEDRLDVHNFSPATVTVALKGRRRQDLTAVAERVVALVVQDLILAVKVEQVSQTQFLDQLQGNLVVELIT